MLGFDSLVLVHLSQIILNFATGTVKLVYHYKIKITQENTLPEFLHPSLDK